jgi:adenylyltransferase/sulfurtransferase
MRKKDGNETIGRYSRQLLLEQIGSKGQEKLLQSTALIIGCGALGSTAASLLTRAGVGKLLIADRDVPELTNLHRQFLFDEEDVTNGLPKAEAAARTLRRINSTVQIIGLVTDITAFNIEDLVRDVSIVVDGTDNFETRYLINDACIKLKKPWVYAGVIGTTGMTMNIFPEEGPCLRCLFPEPPPPGSLPTCETFGILNTIPALIASIQATEACKILVHSKMVSHEIAHIDVWHNSFQRLKVYRSEKCPACVTRTFDFLSKRKTVWVSKLCGRKAVQITPPTKPEFSFERLSKLLSHVGEVTYNDLLLKALIDEYELILFRDGRAIVKGTDDESVAKGVYTKYIGI